MTRFAVALAGWALTIFVIGGAGLQFPVSGQVSKSQKPKRELTGQQIDHDLKELLSDYYLGKPVRAKITIPANESGIEVVDGQLNIVAPNKETNETITAPLDLALGSGKTGITFLAVDSEGSLELRHSYFPHGLTFDQSLPATISPGPWAPGLLLGFPPSSFISGPRL